MDRYYDFLLTLPLFKGLTREQLARLMRCCHVYVETLEKTSLIWWDHHSESVTYLSIILEGQLRLFQEDWQGNRMQLGVFNKGEFFNDNAFYRMREQMPFICEIPANSTLLTLENEKLLQPCAKNCPFHWEHLRNLLLESFEQQAMFFQKISCLNQRSTRGKIMALLSFYAAKENSRTFTLSMSRQEMADELSVDRTGVSKELSLMQKEGLIRYHRNQFELLE